MSATDKRKSGKEHENVQLIFPPEVHHQILFHGPRGKSHSETITFHSFP